MQSWKFVVDYLFSPFTLLITSFIFIFLNIFKKYNNFSNIFDVTKTHFWMFNKAKGQLFIYYGVPLLIAGALIQIKIMDNSIIENINLVISILISMFFAMLGIIGAYDIKENEQYNDILKQTQATISFQIIVCIITLSINFLYCFLPSDNYFILRHLLTFFIYYFIFTIILNIFIVVKRLYVLFEERKKR